LSSQLFRDFNALDSMLFAIFVLAAIQQFASKSSPSWSKPSKWHSNAAKAILVVAIVAIIYQKTSYTTFSTPTPSETTPFIPDNLGFVEITDRNTHPIQQLITKAEDDFQQQKSRQSRTLTDAVNEYKHRYGVHPPPKFDIWFEFATKHKVVLVDEFDTIFHDMKPFWALEPRLLRTRVSEALGFDNGLLAVLIRGGQVAHVGISGANDLDNKNSSATGVEAQTEAIVGMLQSFVHHLPDMDLAFNLHDEPRVILQHNRLSKLMDAADRTMPSSLGNASPLNSYSARPQDMNDGSVIDEVRETRFNRFARQSSWSHARMSCPPESPAQDVFGDSPPDNISSWAFGSLGFVMNATALSNICDSPSLASTHGFFQRPNVFNIAQDLLPIFSPSKISSFSDILYPPSWYWAERTRYDSTRDIPWEDKNSTMYWRGSTTGGFSRRGGWRKHHRQRVVQTLTANDNARVLNRDLTAANSTWETALISRQTLQNHLDIGFTHIGQCDPADCGAQADFFHVLPGSPQSDAWKHKVLLDMDGNAFSGRLASFVASGSAVAKMGVVREALLGDWIKPWVHYVPLSIKGSEWAEVVRYFLSSSSSAVDQVPDGDEAARRIASNGQVWAQRSLRKIDYEVWMFRLLLEYARVMDDKRDEIGYAG
jgi:Glycosyl transferase family 90